MTIEEAIEHPWICSGHTNPSSSQLEDDLKSNLSDIWQFPRERLDVIADSFSKSAEWTTLDSYEKWFIQVRLNSVQGISNHYIKHSMLNTKSIDGKIFS